MIVVARRSTVKKLLALISVVNILQSIPQADAFSTTYTVRSTTVQSHKHHLSINNRSFTSYYIRSPDTFRCPDTLNLSVTRMSAKKYKTTRALYNFRGGSQFLDINKQVKSINILWSSATLTKIWNGINSIYSTVCNELQQLSTIQRWILLTTFLLGITVGQVLAKPFFKRFTNPIDVPTYYYGPKAPYLIGRVISVSDGDTIRFLHKPTIFHSSNINKNNKSSGVKMSDLAMPVRVCTIDTPETAKFGKEGQPYGQEAKNYLSDIILNKIVKIRLLQKDQYGRAVAQVQAPSLRVLTGPFFLLKILLLPAFVIQRVFFQTKFVDELMLRQGLAEVYEGMGAVYGALGKQQYLDIQQEAKSKRIGIWSLKNRESASEYKKRTK